MVKIVRCKRCNRILKSKLSIERGYGKTCYRTVQLQKAEQSEDPNNTVIKELLDRVRKLELDRSYILHQLKHKTIVSNPNMKPIERIKCDEHIPERDKNRINMFIVTKELKTIFQGDNFDYHQILNPIGPTIEIEKPPILETIEIIN
ncbi:MAG: DUF6011 domain-containing protein [Promethearchaeota archaeon]